MENASKALIIAGAILLAIAIIGVAMAVFTGVSDTISGGADSLSTQEIQAYNQEFLAYEGDRRGSLVRSLCDSVSAHNRMAEDPSRTIAVVMGEIQPDEEWPAPTEEGAEGTTTSAINQIKSQIYAGRTYTVTFGYDPDSGLITRIAIQDKSDT
mgnify:CR=1 FL=1